MAERWKPHYTLTDAAGRYINPLPSRSGVKVLKNAPFSQTPTIRIAEGDVGWEDAYRRWLDMMDPTPAKEWRAGIFGAVLLD